jgi:hypothetical protein
VQAHSPDLAFGSGTQRASVCLALLSLVDAAACWTPTGPAPGGQLAPSRAADPDTRTMLAACWALWEGHSTLSLHELLRLSPPRLEAVGELLAAIARGPAAIDAWLERHPPAQGAPPARRRSEHARLLRSR